MELSGMMDNKPQEEGAACGDEKWDGFTVCDLADEEVHFSRAASDYYYRINKAQPGAANCPAAGPTQPGSAASVARHTRPSQSAIHSLDTSNLNAGLAQNLAYESHYIDLSTSGEQARSSKLLHTISNKLRRGSNYLNAPTKLLGHYLLGITIQSWCEFFNTSRMLSAPKTRHQLTRRLATNLSHFQGNYLCVSLILVIYCILTSPLLLIAIAFYLLALYLVTARSALGKQTRVLGYRLNLQQQYSFITMLSMPPLWIAGAPSAVFWVIGASFFVIGLHASMFTNDQVMSEQSAAGPRALPYELSRRQSSVESAGYRELAGAAMSKRSAMHYYNHHPVGVGHKQGYVSLSHGSASTNDARNTTGSSYSSAGGNYVSSTISQWISFGGSGSKHTSTRAAEPGASGAVDAGAASASNGSISSVGQQRVPDVKIISRDYAGLGRVYEV